MARQTQIIQRARKLRKEMTDEEKILWSQLSDYKSFPARFRKQHPIGQYFVDFYSRRAMLIIELDGAQHAEEKNTQYDNERTLFLAKREFLVLRFWNDEIRKNLKAVLEIIWNTCDQRMNK